ncbi:MAG TPA: tripartite tricarboxylate transporter TctB family protein [Burkholderiales bacterium]|nr:tripartite tricarboxylate transporter TctB family protein [Burkholderiales bacterium]
MRNRDWSDVIGGMLLIAVGLYFAIQAGAYDLGTLRRMGPGFFPRTLGIFLVGLGLLIAALALLREGELPKPRLRPFVAILGGILAFAVSVEWVGMVPATFLLVGISALAEPAARPLPTLILAVALSTIAVVIFSQGLSIPLPAYRWPF